MNLAMGCRGRHECRPVEPAVVKEGNWKRVLFPPLTGEVRKKGLGSGRVRKQWGTHRGRGPWERTRRHPDWGTPHSRLPCPPCRCPCPRILRSDGNATKSAARKGAPAEAVQIGHSFTAHRGAHPVSLACWALGAQAANDELCLAPELHACGS